MPERYKQIRNALIDLSGSFDALSRRCDFLFHDLLYAPEGTGNAPDSWKVSDLELAESHFLESSCWQQFKVSKSGFLCRCYWSLENCTWAVWTFELFCSRGWKLLVEISKLSPEHLPKHFCSDAIRPVRDLNPVENWLTLLHEFSFRFPTVDLQGECESLQIGDLKCITNSIDVNVVAASAIFIDAILNPDFFAQLGRWESPLELELPEPQVTPFWNPESGELWFGDQLLKRFRSDALNQRLVLDAFETSDWREQIEMPETVPSNARSSFADKTITDLNSSLRDCPLTFGRVQDGKFLRWYLR